MASQRYYPYVKINGARTNAMAVRATEILGATHREVKKASEARIRLNKSQKLLTHCRDFKGGSTDQFERLSSMLELKYKPSINYSKLDWMVSSLMQNK